MHFAGGAMLLSGPAAAQSSGEGDRIQDRFEDREPPKSQIRPLIPAPEEVTPPDQADEISFTLNGITIEGSTVYDAGEFATYYQDLVGQEITLARIFDIAAQITTRYRQDGYIISRAIVPQQEISGGNVRIRVVEGFIADVKLEGDTAGAPRLLNAYANKIARGSILHKRDLERYVLLADDIPGHQVRAVLAPSENGGPGAADLTLVVERDIPDIFVSFDNRGSQFIGPYQGEIGVAENTFFGLGERLMIRGVSTLEAEELRFLEARAELPITSEGTTLGLFASYVETSPGDDLEQFDAGGENIFAGIRVDHPFIRSREMNLNVGLQIDARDSESYLAGDIESTDKLRVVRLSAAFDFLDRFLGVTQLYVEGSQGINVFDAHANSRMEAESDFTSFYGEVRRYQRITNWLSAELAAAGQYALDPLPSAEEFGVGGKVYGRGYDPSETVGDHGVAMYGELQLNNLFGFVSDFTDGFVEGVQLYGFYDHGITWNRDEEQDARTDLSSAGGGVRMKLIDRVSAQLEVAKPLDEEVDGVESDGWRFFFEVGARF